MSDTLKAYVLFPNAAISSLYDGWLNGLSLPTEVVREYNTEWTPPDDAGIVITHNHYRWEELSILRRVYEQGRVPVLILVDGILEFRNSFQHADLADGTMFQPLFGHKLACVGPSQVRWIEALGNAGKCELVGLPRLDEQVNCRLKTRMEIAAGNSKPQKSASPNKPFRLLVASAMTPWFDDQQREETTDAMTALKEHLSQVKVIDGRQVQVTWRMNETLHSILQVPGFQRKRPPLHDVFAETDAVITTPSTLQLEAAIFGLPVAVLDFHQCPQMTAMAWTIGHIDQIATTIEQLVDPLPARRFAQDVLLADALQCDELALPRAQKLVKSMVEEGVRARQAGESIQLPDRILRHPSDGFSAEQPSGAKKSLYPDHPAFFDEQVGRLQTELAAAIHEMGNYPEKYFDQRTSNLKMRGYINWLRLLIRNRAATIQELTSAINHLRSSDSDRSVKE